MASSSATSGPALRKQASRQIIDIRRFRRLQFWLAIVSAVALAASIGAAVLLLVANDRQGQGIQQLNASLATTCDQTDQAKLPGGVAQDCARAQQGVLPPVLQGLAGDNGTDGRDGRDGRDGEDGADAVSIPGRDGTNGTNGINGQSPPCLNEPTACRGAMGDPGVPGMPPVGWTTEFPDGGRQTCARVADFNPDAPFYDCDYQGPAPAAEQPEPTQEPGLGTN